MNHYCTYFDRTFLIQGMTLAASLQDHDHESVLWVLALDDYTLDFLRELRAPGIRVVPLRELEQADDGLLAAKSSRTRVEYYFTLSPCWPRYLLQCNPAMPSITYVDADMFWFASPRAVLAELENASILVTEHRHPRHLAHHRRYGRFNVGLLSFKNDSAGLSCLDLWRSRCLDWCYDRLEENRYADQKYLDEWPSHFGAAVGIVKRLGINLAPWNWSQYHYTQNGCDFLVDGEPIELFHFARFRPTHGTWCFQSGQLEYGVMPWALRQYLYGNYWKALTASRDRIRVLRPNFDFVPKSTRGWHLFWRALLPRIIFGSDWIRLGPVFISGRLGLGRFSGRFLSWARNRMHDHIRRSMPADSRPPMSPSPAESMEPVGGAKAAAKNTASLHS